MRRILELAANGGLWTLGRSWGSLDMGIGQWHESRLGRSGQGKDGTRTEWEEKGTAGA